VHQRTKAAADKAAQNAQTQSPAPAQDTVRRALDGIMVPKGTPEPDYVAATIDNIAEALPQSGVAKAPLVIEAPVEGGLTRLFAFFPSDAAFDKLGPVRSARPYFVDWAQEYGAMFAHVGGSPEGLDKLASSGVRNLDEMHDGASFWRDNGRPAPHNTYTSSDKLAKAFAARPRTAKPLSPWKFKEEPALADRSADAFEVTLGEMGKWRVRWRYDRDANAYARILATGPQKDADGTPVLAKNVLVQFVKVDVLDEKLRVRIDDLSGGDARIIMDGRVIGGSWKKASAAARTRFYDAAGNEIAVNAGTTWIEVVPVGTPVTQ
jgi:hypothetical protein